MKDRERGVPALHLAELVHAIGWGSLACTRAHDLSGFDEAPGLALGRTAAPKNLPLL